MLDTTWNTVFITDSLYALQLQFDFFVHRRISVPIGGRALARARRKSFVFRTTAYLLCCRSRFMFFFFFLNTFFFLLIYIIFFCTSFLPRFVRESGRFRFFSFHYFFLFRSPFSDGIASYRLERERARIRSKENKSYMYSGTCEKDRKNEQDLARPSVVRNTTRGVLASLQKTYSPGGPSSSDGTALGWW